MMTDEEPVSVVVFSELIPEGDHFRISFTLDHEVSGVEAASHQLIFQPGSYALKIHLPEGFSGDPQVLWFEDCPPKPLGFESSRENTWIQIGLKNDLPNGEEDFPFELSADSHPEEWRVLLKWPKWLTWLKRLLLWLWLHFIPQVPAIVSDPPPTIVFTAS
jgi:hypothetical protein